MKQKGFTPLFVVISLAVLGIISVYLYGVNKPPHVIPTNQAESFSNFTSSASKYWKTYSNNKYRYSFKYPPDWYISDIHNKESINVYSDNGNYNLYVDMRNEAKVTRPISTWVKNKNLSGSGSDFVTNDTTLIAGEKTIVISSVNEGYVSAYTYYLDKNNNIYSIILTMPASASEIMKDTLNEILSSFKFTD